MINPRLNDQFRLPFNQDDVDFLIPHLLEDLPLCIDPFLLWKSDKAEYIALHEIIISFFDELRRLALSGQERAAIASLLRCQEAREIGLGYTKASKEGQSVGPILASQIVSIFNSIPQLQDVPLSHIEAIQLLVPRVGEDRMSDITASILKRHLISFTEKRARDLAIPSRPVTIQNVWDHESLQWMHAVKATLPCNPIDQTPILLVPLEWLRHLPWINYEDYYRSYYAQHVLPPDYRGRTIHKAEVLAFNKANYREAERYIQQKESNASQCFPEYIFAPLSLATQRERFAEIRGIPTGLENGAAKDYERLCFEFLQSALFPKLDFAACQSRTDSGTHIRDVIFYNDGKTNFLKDLRERFHCRQLIFELKNVKKLDPQHIDQLHRYLGGDFGSFGVLVTRNPTPQNVERNLIDLHSAKRIVIICLDDSDLELMTNVQEARLSATEVLKKKFVELQRKFPC